MGTSIPEDQTSWWLPVQHPFTAAQENVFKPLQDITANFLNAWNLGDLVEDLKFRAERVDEPELILT